MPLSKNHYVHLENGLLNGVDYSERDLDDLFRNMRDHQDGGTLALHFHGGLVSRKSGLEIGERMLGGCYMPPAYPVFFVWESHPLETIKNNLGEIAAEVIFKSLLKHVSQFALAKLREDAGGRGTRLELPQDDEVWSHLDLLQRGGLPFAGVDAGAVARDAVLSETQLRQFGERLEADVKFIGAARALAANILPEGRELHRGARVETAVASLISPSVIDEIRASSEHEASRGLFSTARLVKGALSILVNVIGRFAQRRDHGFFPTIVEEILRELYAANAGGFVWKMMKKDTADAFDYASQGNSGKRRGGAGFLRRLDSAWMDGYKPRVILIGHSTGAIFICNLLKAADSMGLTPEIKFDVVFLAPAVTFEQFAGTLSENSGRINGFRSFGMQDDIEKADKLLGIAYPRSLLYLVSGILEDEPDKPIVGMQRYFSQNAPFEPGRHASIDECIRFVDKRTNSVVWSEKNDGPGLASGARKHGDFDNDTATLESVRHICGKGF